MSPRFGISTQRKLIDILSLTVPAVSGVRTTHLTLGEIPTSRVDATHADHADAPSSAEKTAVLYLHGGGFVIGSAWCYRALTSRLARWTGLPIFVPDYHLAPEHPHPAQLNDALSCVEALAASGWPTDRLIIAGDSAGGNLSLAVVQALHAKGLPGPRALALISPWSDASSSGDRQAKDAVIDPLWIDTLRPLIGPEDLLKTQRCRLSLATLMDSRPHSFNLRAAKS
ncbi:MAG: alpha/beta hydrolase fold domain-containing protein [Burkholderiaceae bacterium]